MRNGRGLTYGISFKTFKPFKRFTPFKSLCRKTLFQSFQSFQTLHACRQFNSPMIRPKPFQAFQPFQSFTKKHVSVVSVVPVVQMFQWFQHLAAVQKFNSSRVQRFDDSRKASLLFFGQVQFEEGFEAALSEIRHKIRRIIVQVTGILQEKLDRREARGGRRGRRKRKH